jgi:hypothetical protein
MTSDDCASNIHEFCNPCDCECHTPKTFEVAKWLAYTLRVQGAAMDDGIRVFGLMLREWASELEKALLEDGVNAKTGR